MNKYTLEWEDDTLMEWESLDEIPSKLAEIGYTEDFDYTVGDESIQIYGTRQIEANSDFEAIGRGVVYIRDHPRAIDTYKITNDENKIIFKQ